MKDANTHVPVSRVGRKLLNVVSVALFFSLGFVLGMTSNSMFPNFYLPFMPSLPSSMPSLHPPLSPTSSPPPPPPLLPTPSPPPPLLPPPTPSALSPAQWLLSPQSMEIGLLRELAPSNVMHNMTDEELFWWASMAPKVGSTPYHRVPKVAFLFLVHGDLPLRPLWEKFFAGHQGLYSIYMHTDPSYTGSPPKDSVFYGRMIPSQKTIWGDASLLAAERRLLANALLDLNNERFALVSESCIPLYNFTTIYTLLTGSNTSFVDSFATPSRYNTTFADRNNITVRQWRKGAQWFEMDRAFAVEVVSDVTYFPTFRDHCVGIKACLMDEHYLPTLVNVLPWPRNANRTLTFANWRWRNNGPTHPHKYGAREVTEELIGEIRGGAGRNCTAFNDGANGFCSVFARKFAPDTLEPLLRLAPKVMGFG